MTPTPCGAKHPEAPRGHCYCNLTKDHSGPHFSAYSNTQWSNDSTLEGQQK